MLDELVELQKQKQALIHNVFTQLIATKVRVSVSLVRTFHQCNYYEGAVLLPVHEGVKTVFLNGPEDDGFGIGIFLAGRYNLQE